MACAETIKWAETYKINEHLMSSHLLHNAIEAVAERFFFIARSSIVHSIGKLMRFDYFIQS